MPFCSYHTIFDGDAVFLRKQAGRMAMSGKSFRDYSTPGSSDVILNAYRRYLEHVSQISKNMGHESSAEAVTSNAEVYENADSTPRSVLLDRFSSHTVHCSVCQKALRRWAKGASIAEVLVA